MNYKESTLTSKYCICKLQKKGNVDFVEILIQDSLSDEIIKVRRTDKTDMILFVKEAKDGHQIYDCYDTDSRKIKDVFLCGKCNDLFSKTGGNKNRHIFQHLKSATISANLCIISKIRLFIYKHALPYSIVEDEVFRELFSVKLPSVETFLKQMSSDYDKLLIEIQKNIDMAENISLTLDEWTFHNISYIGITAYLSGENIPFDNIVLALSSPLDFDRTAVTISGELKSQSAHFNFDEKLEAAVTDCASVMIKALSDINFPWSPCLAHIVHNAAKKMLLSVDGFEEAMKNANILHNDYIFKQYWLTTNYAKGNIQSYVDTRWLSRANTCSDIAKYYPMMKQYENLMNCLIQVRKEKDPHIEKYVLPITPENYQICLNNNSILEKVKYKILKIEKRNPDGIFTILKSLTKLCSYVVHSMDSCGFSGTGMIFLNYIISKLEKYVIGVNIGIGALLNPNIAIQQLIDSDNPFHICITKGKEAISKFFENDSNSVSSPIPKAYTRVRRELNEFETWENTVEPIKDSILNYWRLMKIAYPKLSELARKISSIPLSSSDSERLFSMAKHVMNPTRNRLSAEHYNMSVLLYTNIAIFKDHLMSTMSKDKQ